MLAKPRPHKKRSVTESLRTLIAERVPGDRLPTVADLREHFGASASTVVTALEELEREGLLVRRHGSGTFVADRKPIPPASRIRTGLVAITSFVITSSELFTAILQAAEQEMRTRDLTPLLILDSNEESRFRAVRERWERGEIDGYLQIGSVLGGAIPRDVPGIIVGEMPEEAAAHQVVMDNVGAGQRVGEHLLALGHQRCALVYPSYMQIIAVPRLQGLRAAWRHAGLTVEPEELPLRVPEQPAATAVEKTSLALKPLLERPDPVTAFIAVNDVQAVTIIRALNLLGRAVPEDCSVVGFDDQSPLSTHFQPTLTTVRFPGPILGTLAAQTLRHILETPEMPFRRLTVPAELIVRESTAPPPDA